MTTETLKTIAPLGIDGAKAFVVDTDTLATNGTAATPTYGSTNPNLITVVWTTLADGDYDLVMTSGGVARVSGRIRVATPDVTMLDEDVRAVVDTEVTAARMAALTDWIDGGRLDLLLDAITPAGPTKTELDTAESNIVNAVNAVNSGAARYISIATSAAYELPDSGAVVYPIEVRTFDQDGEPAAIDSGADPTMTVTRTTDATDLTANLSAITSPATAVYRMTITITEGVDTVAPLRIDASGLINAVSRSTSTYPVVTDAVSVDFTAADRANLALILEDTGTTIPASIATLPSADDVADQVWDEARIDHTTVGSFGEYTGDVEIGGSQWNIMVRGAVGLIGPSLGSDLSNIVTEIDENEVRIDLLQTDLDTLTAGVNVTEFLGTAITETTAGRFADNLSVFWDNADVDTTQTVDDVGTGGGGGGGETTSFSAAALLQLVQDDTGETTATAGSVAAIAQGGAVDNSAQLTRIEDQTSLITAGRITVTGGTLEGSTGPLYQGSDYNVTAGTAYEVQFSDAGEVIKTRLQDTDQTTTILFGAGRAQQANQIVGTIDADNITHASNVTTIKVEITAAALATAPLDEEYIYHVKRVNSAGKESVEVSGSVPLRAERAAVSS